MRIAYVCEGGGTIGWGHVGRARAFSESAGSGATILLGRGFDEIARWCVEHQVDLPIHPWEAPGVPFSPSAAQFDAVIVDHYSLGDEWLRAVNERVPVFLVDDWMRSGAPVDVIVNPNIGARRSDYAGHARDWLLGAEYALIRREVREAHVAAPIRGEARHLLVTLGGSDPDGRTAQVVEAIADTPWFAAVGAVTAVLGPSYAGAAPWESWPATRRARLEVVRQPRDYVSRCASADVVICGASTTSYELALLQRPFIPLAIVDNQARVAAEWAAAGAVERICVWEDGWLERLVARAASLLASDRLRDEVAALGRGSVDGRGSERLVDACGRLASAGSARSL